MIKLRQGKCLRCGRCCNMYCPHLFWVANTNINAGEAFFNTGVSEKLMRGCTLDGTEMKGDTSVYGGSCVTFPSEPMQTPEGCGFYWIDVSCYGDDSSDVYYPPKP